MGCDYYVKTVLKVKYTDLSITKIVLSEERHWWLADPEFDSDDPKEVRDKAIAEYERECEREMEKHTKSKLLYENKLWLTDNEENIKYYTSLIKNFNNVTKIEKLTFAYPR